MSETPVESAPELEDPIGLQGPSLMGVAPWVTDAPLPAPPETAPPPQTPAELRAQAEKLLAEADSLENPSALRL